MFIYVLNYFFKVNVYCDEGHHEMPPEVKKNHEECRKELGLTDGKN